MNNLTPEERTIVLSMITATKDLVALVQEAAEVRHTPAPSSYAAKGTGPDPTADAVLEPRREDVADTLTKCIRSLFVASVNLRHAEVALREALDAYTA